jgi:hypothetical protein
MRHSFAAFLTFFLVGLTIIALEALFLAARFDQFLGRTAENSSMTVSLSQRETALQRFMLKKDEFERKADLLLSGYNPEPLVVGPLTFGDLFSLGVQISPQEASSYKGVKIWTYKLSSSTLEYHRLMPAISALESQYPLGRFIEIDLRSKRPPFALAPGPIDFTGIFSTLRGRQ